MVVTTNQYNDLYKFAHATCAASWRCTILVRNPAVRDWLVKTSCDGIKLECQTFSDASNPGVRESLHSRIMDYVTTANQVSQGGEVTFVILPIILAAVLSWLIQKLLDHLFSKGKSNA